MVYNAQPIETREALFEIVQQLQSYFSISREIDIPRDVVRDLYSAVALCLRHTTMSADELGYIRGNLHLPGQTPSAIANEVDIYRQSIDRNCTNHFQIDLALRSIGVPLRDYPVTLSVGCIQQIASWLQPLWDIMQRGSAN